MSLFKVKRPIFSTLLQDLVRNRRVVAATVDGVTRFAIRNVINSPLNRIDGVRRNEQLNAGILRQLLLAARVAHRVSV
ncbi:MULTISPECIES: hypothetical protein [unclassified Caballeronia]|uniref:hypothetical protein n=1 Tax=unclassified Caballeronia TaxID=2646786 RepID=UPI0020285236|nr:MULTISPECIES: hypothetical protein [unclassified Caballeronia]